MSITTPTAPAVRTTIGDVQNGEVYASVTPSGDMIMVAVSIGGEPGWLVLEVPDDPNGGPHFVYRDVPSTKDLFHLPDLELELLGATDGQAARPAARCTNGCVVYVNKHAMVYLADGKNSVMAFSLDDGELKELGTGRTAFSRWRLVRRSGEKSLVVVTVKAA